MHHLAILKKDWNLIPKILSGDKSIETRWYKNKIKPWNKVNIGDEIYFKNTGSSVCAKAIIERVEFLEINSEIQRQNLIEKIWLPDLCDEILIPELKTYAKDKKYCIIVYLKNPQAIEPFQINKKGFGLQAAWITIPDINQIRV